MAGNGGKIRRGRETNFLPSLVDSMVSHLASNIVLPVDFYVHLANACHKIQPEKSKGSGTLARAKQCCFCHRSINLGSGSSTHSLQQHMLSYNCQNQQKRFLGSNCTLSSILSDLNLPNLSPAVQTSHPQSVSDSEQCNPTSSSSLTMGHKESGMQPEHSDACLGAFVNYDMSMFSHYPWHLHDLGVLNYEFSYIDPKGRYFRVCSKQCSRISPEGGGACDACNRVILGRQFQELVKRASLDPLTSSSTKLSFWTYSQLCSILNEKTSKLNDLKLKVRMASYVTARGSYVIPCRSSQHIDASSHFLAAWTITYGLCTPLRSLTMFQLAESFKQH